MDIMQALQRDFRIHFEKSRQQARECDTQTQRVIREYTDGFQDLFGRTHKPKGRDSSNEQAA